MICIQTLQAHSHGNTSCPECRTIMTSFTPNYALNTSSEQLITKDLKIGSKKKILVHDNSGSMRKTDGKLLIINHDETIYSKEGVYRYQEAEERAKMIVEQSIKDGEEITIYLLNQISNGKDYVEDVDFITINKNNFHEKQGKLDNLLSEMNIHGSTPLGDITRKITKEINNHYKENKRGVKYSIIFNTDGQPNSTVDFEETLKLLIMTVPCTLVFNIISDDSETINYYNDMDVNLNKGIEETCPSVDILDDYSGEAQEVYNYNSWFVYTLELHQKRIWYKSYCIRYD